MTDSIGWTPAQPAAGPAAPRSESPRRGAPALWWSWKLVTVAGIDVYVHATFLLLIAFVAFGDLVTGRRWAKSSALVKGRLQ
jgi:hypothetical protein